MTVSECVRAAGEGELVSPGPRSSPGTLLTGVRETTQHGECLLLSSGLSPGRSPGLLSATSQEEPQDQHEEDDGQEEHGGAED